MFSDLTNNSLNSVKLNNVKAYPSVNSPNDGGFNSEENLRWLINKILTKPFITGIDEEDIEKAFSKNGGAGHGDFIRHGMFSADGYTIKIADQNNLSFDAGVNTNSYITNNTQYLQRFAHSLTNQGTSNELSATLSDFAFLRYTNQTSGEKDQDQLDSWAALEDNLDNQNIIGFIKMIYEDDFAQQITINYENNNPVSVTFGATTILIDNTITSSTTQDQLEILDNTTDPVTYRTNPVAFLTTTSSSTIINIFYPVIVQNVDTWNYNTNSYQSVPTIYFTDIFGLTFKRGICSSSTKSYPRTNSVFIDMVNNTLLSTQLGTGIAFDDCNLKTVPTFIYNSAALYTNDERISSSASMPANYQLSGFTMDVDSIKYTVNSTTYNLFTKVSHSATDSTNIFNFMPSGSPITSMNSQLDYYCITSIPDNLRIEITNLNGTTVYIPVAFMTSDGSLCPYGYISKGNYGSATISTSYPVEGYLHFLKRQYANANGLGQDQIDNVTVSQLCAWSGLSELYSKYISPCVSFYLDMSYSSLMQYVMFNTGSSDANKMKSIVCGNALSQFKNEHSQTDAYLTDEEFTITQSLSFENGQYTYNTATNSYTASNYSSSVSYGKDVDSDYYKAQKGLITGSETDSDYVLDHTLLKSPVGFSNITDFNITDNNKYYYSVEDPINFIRKCGKTTSDTNTISNVTFYNLNKSGNNTFVMQPINSDTGGVNIKLSSATSGVANLQVDNYLMPTKVTQGSIDATGTIAPVPDDVISYKLSTNLLRVLSDTHTNATANSIVNGQCLSFNIYTWYISVPYVITLNKDSLNYLMGVDYTNPVNYAGVSLNCKLPQNVLSTDLMIALLDCSTNPVVGSYDIETSDRVYDTTSKKIKRAREACIHFDRLYGEDNQSLDDRILEVVNDSKTVNNIETDINTLQNNVSTLTPLVNNSLQIVKSGYILIGSDNTDTDTNKFISSIDNGSSYDKLLLTSSSEIALDLTYVILEQQTINFSGQAIGNTNYISGITVDHWSSSTQTLDETSSKLYVRFTNNSGSNLDSNNKCRFKYTIVQHTNN